MAKVFKDVYLSTYAVGEWTNIYSYTNSDASSTNRSIILSLLARNTKNAGRDSSIDIEIRITNSTTNTIIYPIIKATLSAQDEFKIDRTKQFFVLEAGWKLQVKFSKADVYVYASVLENV